MKSLLLALFLTSFLSASLVFELSLTANGPLEKTLADLTWNTEYVIPKELDPVLLPTAPYVEDSEYFGEVNRPNFPSEDSFLAELVDLNGRLLDSQVISLNRVEEETSTKIVFYAQEGSSKVLLKDAFGKVFYEVELTPALDRLDTFGVSLGGVSDYSSDGSSAEEITSASDSETPVQSKKKSSASPGLVGLIVFLALVGIAVVAYLKVNGKKPKQDEEVLKKSPSKAENAKA